MSERTVEIKSAAEIGVLIITPDGFGGPWAGVEITYTRVGVRPVSSVFYRRDLIRELEKALNVTITENGE